VTVLNPDGTKDESGRWIQVSRLGNPLVNEVVIGVGQKDLFNATGPAQDSQFLSRVTSPLLAVLLNAIFGLGAPTTNRQDLVAVFLTGIKGLNQPAKLTVPGDQLRLNMAIAPSSTDPNAVNRLGVLGGQSDGYPNGRRLADDVVDIALQAVDGATCGLMSPPCTPGQLSNSLGDGVTQNDVLFQSSFPYLADPHSP
jgi:hypothetical protein